MIEDENRWARITADDHSGTLYIVTFLGLTYTGITFLTRLLIKWHMLGLDDLAMLLAEIANVTQVALLLASLSAGLAKSYDSLGGKQYAQMAQTYAGAQVALYIALGLSKMASILLVRRLFIRDMRSAWAICNIITGIIAAWTLLSASLVSAGCSNDSLSPKNSQDMCVGIKTRYLIVVVTDCLTDAILAFIPTYLCRRLQMNLLFKLQILGVFALRLPLLLFAILFYTSWSKHWQSDNPGVARTTALVYQQCQLCSSLIAATIPCLKSFIQSFDTGSGQKAGFGYSSNSGAYGHMSTIHHSATQADEYDDSYPMTRLDRTQTGVTRLRYLGSNTNIMGTSGKSSSAGTYDAAENFGADLEERKTSVSGRNSEQSTHELVIRREVQFDVKREPARKRAEAHQPGLLRLPK
ncbi:hypothetical protein E8E13_001092 [Curvularia kusanoi]|uniref:Rhodopsin domain-containing protein n=1 Tax=Curvularia kusanoi TaxID=90978 RepID=A0A9P4TBX3_CURKU|nr:hypothetical protein E8E13_001092 [Curvularia kusanoi]